jgi:D-alanyl-D-alanine carboxypeptidase
VRITDEPDSITVLINKSVALPEEYVPSDLVEPNVRFIFEEKHEKRLMRAEAARALESLFAAAEKDGIYLAGVSGYRSFETQNALFTYYVNTDGEELARRYSAEPGQSEHQTGLAMDVSGSTGACAADDCFAGTPEANWLAAHAHEHGFIIRYPAGKEAITGYMYEPWHVRYLGKQLSADIYARGVTYEEYLGFKQ